MTLVFEYYIYTYNQSTNKGFQMHTYTVYKINVSNGSLSHKEHLNNLQEVNEWLGRVYNKHVSVLIVSDQTGVKKLLIDNGEWYEEK